MRSVACAPLVLGRADGGGRSVGAVEASDAAGSGGGGAPPADETPADETPADETPADETPADETPDDGTPDGFAASRALPSHTSSSERMASGGGSGGGMGVRATPFAGSDFLLAWTVPALSLDRRIVISARVSGVWGAPLKR
jgi:hypothetical protein